MHISGSAPTPTARFNVEYLPHEDQQQLANVTAKVQALAHKVQKSRQDKNVVVPAFSLNDLGFGKNLAADTFHMPRGSEAITKIADEFRNNGSIVLSMYLSAKQLDMIHPGTVEHAPHLHPSEPGMTTGELDDMKRIRVVWQYKRPKTSELHPEAIALTDGRLVAAWLAKEEHLPDLKAFDDHTASCMDILGGNAGALHKSFVKRMWSSLKYRFHSYGRGIKEGLCSPRFNGSIGANLLLTSLPITALLYGIFYGLEYMITKHEMAEADQAAASSTKAAAKAVNPNYSLTA